MKRTQKKREKGFTIPELLVALFVFSLVTGGATNMLLSGIAAQALWQRKNF